MMLCDELIRIINGFVGEILIIELKKRKMCDLL